MKRKQGFTLIELLVVISIIALLIGLLLPALAAARKVARQMKSNTQIRGIHQSLVTFAEQNNGNYPGLTAKGKISNPTNANSTQAISGTGNGVTVEYRFGTLLDKNFFTGEYCISPFESKIAWTTQALDSNNYSYATLKISDTTQVDQSPSGSTGRRREWKNKLNSEAAIITDRARGAAPGSGTYSVQTREPSGRDNWEGGVVFNDNHSVTENTYTLNTKYGSADNNIGTNDTPLDNIFIESDGFGTNGNDDANAFMIHSGATALTFD